MKADNKYALIRTEQVDLEIKSLVRLNKRRYKATPSLMYFNEALIRTDFLRIFTANSQGNLALVLLPRNWKALLRHNYSIKELQKQSAKPKHQSNVENKIKD